MGFRCAYSLDGQGYDFSSSYAKKYAKKSDSVAIPTKKPEFTRCAYSLDAQGHNLSYPKEYSSTSTTPVLSRNNSDAMLGDDGEWRAAYDLGQRPHLAQKHSDSSTTSNTQPSK